MSVIAWIVIGLLAGWLATRIMGGRGGLMRNLAVGLVGAIVGGFLFEKLQTPSEIIICQQPLSRFCFP